MRRIEQLLYLIKKGGMVILEQVVFGHCLVLVALGLSLWGCSDFVEVDPPKNTLISETVFDDAATVESALANLYFEMREQGMVSGSFGLTTGMGIYTDELDYFASNADYSQLYQHNVIAGNNLVFTWWSQAYHLIYGANDIIRGVEISENLTDDERKWFKGQALFVRAYVHSLLVGMYGDVPYITTTDYVENNGVNRMAVGEVYERVIVDLNDAVVLFEESGMDATGRILPDAHVAKALLARMYLYTEEWEKAVTHSTELIGAFSLEQDLDRVFLKDSPETIWQLKADADFPKNTREAGQLIIQGVPGQTYALTDDLLGAFETDDLRRDHWVHSISNGDGTITLFYAYKYKADLNVTVSLEYSILFRLAEQFLIRAEARARLGNITGAQADLNRIRNRAGLPDTAFGTLDGLMEAIIQERRIELFTEQGHRWFDLKRTGRADEVLGALKSNWKPTDVLLPIPEAELETNPNLLPQNNGY
tara:strand:+ start:179 stop:1615 length:1437 start_codon:yes stop_codon:yes gene_type:complete